MVENERKGDNSGETGGKDTKKLRVLLCTFGCQMNFRDSEVICGLLKKEGYKITDDPNKTDIVLFNTCSVRQHAEDKVWSEIGRLTKRKKRDCFVVPPKGGIPRNDEYISKPIIGIVGCMAQSYKEAIFERAPEVDFVVGPRDIHKIPSILEDVANSKLKTQNSKLFETKIWETDGKIRLEEIYHTGYREDKNHAYIVISEGCSNYCSYCVVPYVRGELHNRNYKNILREIEEAIDKGITSITLLGQNVNAFTSGHRENVNFVQLLELVNKVKSPKEFSFITSHPKDTSVDLFKIMAECEKLKKHLHLPVQSGSDRILKLMNRGYTRGQYLDLVEKYRNIVLGGTLTTDVIVGFPTEAERDFLETYELMKEIKFDSAYIFKYSPRPHTEAEKLADDVPREEKERRHKVLLDFQKGLHHKRNAISVLICIFLSVLICVSSYAMLDIFDHPKEIEKKERIIEKEKQANFLDYPNESFLKGNYEKALSSCQKLLNSAQAKKSKGEILYLAGLSCLKLNRSIEARSYFDDIILMKNISQDLKINADLGIADSYFLDENFEKARDAYGQILSGYPESQIACIIYYRLSQALEKMGREEEARYYLDKIQKEFPLSFEARLTKDFSIKPNIEINELYTVQVGCFNDKDNADRFCEKLVKEGFDAYILESQSEEPRFRVKVGRLDSKEAAQTLEDKLKQAGYSTKIYP